MEKNSFSLLETILALAVLSLLVSGFLPFTYYTTDASSSINQIKNFIVLNQANEYINTYTLGYTTSHTMEYSLTAGDSILHKKYDDKVITFQYYELIEHPTNPILFKATQ